MDPVRLLAILAVAAVTASRALAAEPPSASSAPPTSSTPPPPRPPECGHGIAAHGRCVCEPDYAVGPDGICDAPRPPLICGRGGVAVKGRCLCRPGWINGPRGACYRRFPRAPGRDASPDI